MSSVEDKSDHQTANEAGGNYENNLPSANSNKTGEQRVLLFIGELITFGVVGLILWPLSDHLSQNGYEALGTICRFLSIISFAAIAPISALKFWQRPCILFSGYGLVCIGVLLVMLATSHDTEDRPLKPANDSLK